MSWLIASFSEIWNPGGRTGMGLSSTWPCRIWGSPGCSYGTIERVADHPGLVPWEIVGFGCTQYKPC